MKKSEWPNSPEFIEESSTGIEFIMRCKPDVPTPEGPIWSKGEMYPTFYKQGPKWGRIVVSILACIGFIVYSIVLLCLGGMLV